VSLTLSVPMSVCLSVTPLEIDSSLFRFSMKSIHFWPSILRVEVYKTLFLDFCFRPPNAQNLLPKVCTKSPISWLVWQIDRRCLGLLGGLRDGRFNGTMQNVVGPTLEIWARRADLVAYWFVCLFDHSHFLRGQG